MRYAFVETLLEQAEANERIMLLAGDLGFGVLDEFSKRFPDRFVNVGIAEQNMAGIAAGLAMCGKIVFTYSIANFPTLRCLEQIRNDICYHDANVVTVAVGGGLCYGGQGMSHFATEDLAVMRTLPGMRVVAPGDPTEVRAATKFLSSGNGPGYLRLGKGGEPTVAPEDVDWTFGKARRLRDGGDLTILSIGGMLATAMEVAAILETKAGLQSRVLSIHTLKPFDEEAVLAAATETRGVVTLEEHSIIGGLGSAVAEVLAEKAELRIPFRRFALPSEFSKEVGGQKYLLRHYGLDAEGITSTLLADI